MCAMSPRLLRPRASGFISPDADARAYLAAVRQADGANLEPAVAKAISDFVIGCKSDGIWDDIKASCILAGAHTLSGALIPLKGTAPTNNNFVGVDYDRKTGLKGDGETTYLNSNRNNNADPQDSKHLSVYYTVRGGFGYIGTTANNGGSWYFNGGATESFVRINSNAGSSVGVSPLPPAFVCVSRSVADDFDVRFGGTTTNYENASADPFSGTIDVFRVAAGTISDARLAWYSIGEAIALADLDTRVTALITAIGAAI